MTTRPSPTPSDRARGALLGLAIGDALGAPLVGLGREQAQIKHATVSTFLGGGLYLLAPGETTGRVAFVRAAAVALAGGPPDLERMRMAYIEALASAGPGVGEATQAALRRQADGLPAAASVVEAHEAVERRTAGIGPALRAVPYALKLRDAKVGDAKVGDAKVGDARVGDVEVGVDEAVLADAALTHRDPRAGATALALVLWVREHLRGEDDPAAALAAVRERLADRPELPDVLPAPAAVHGVRVRATAFGPDVLHATVAHVLRAKTARAAIVGAVNEAGEAAALGAATGAVVGARFGASALPDAWTKLLRGASAWQRLADRLVAPIA